MIKTILEINKIIKGEICGDPLYRISGVSMFEKAKKKDITYINDFKLFKKIHLTKAGAIIIPKQYEKKLKNNIKTNIIKSKVPKIVLAKLLDLFYPKKTISFKKNIIENIYIDSTSYIKKFVYIGKNTQIGSHCLIHSGSIIGSNVKIGNYVTLHPNVVIMKNSIIGNRVTIQSGSTIGSDGFGFIKKKFIYNKIPHKGIAQIDDDVTIGNSNTIDRGTIGKTWIKSGVKTDNLVHIAHNVVIGKNTLIIANVNIAGSTTINNNVIIAGKSGISGHLNIGKNTIIGPKSGIVKNVPPNNIVSGFTAMPHKQWLKLQLVLPKLPNIIKTINKLKKLINKKIN